jgi:hypothetical protein
MQFTYLSIKMFLDGFNHVGRVYRYCDIVVQKILLFPTSRPRI